MQTLPSGASRSFSFRLPALARIFDGKVSPASFSAPFLLRSCSFICDSLPAARGHSAARFLLRWLLSLPLLGFSLLTREALGLGDAFFLLAFGLGAGFRRLLFVLTLGSLAAALFSLCLLCLRFGRLRSVGTQRLPLLPFLLLPALGSLFFFHGGLS